MRNRTRRVVATLLEHARYEVLPTPSIVDVVCAELPAGRTLTVTASAAKGLDATLDVSEALVRAGYRVVPHVAARMVPSSAALAEIVERLRELGVRELFVPGGDETEPGEFPDALRMLRALHELDHPFTRIGITGYPEPHPTISDDLTIQSMWDKRLYATHVVSNLTFDAKTVEVWLRRMRARGVTLPLLLGLPGPVERTKLLAMATKIGVGQSTRFLAKHKGTFARLAAPGGFTGDSFLRDCAHLAEEPTLGLEGLHVFTFNQVARAEAWRCDLLARLGQ